MKMNEGTSLTEKGSLLTVDLLDNPRSPNDKPINTTGTLPKKQPCYQHRLLKKR